MSIVVVDKISEEELKSVVACFEEASGVDFSDYAEASFKRRIIRIIDLYKLRSVAELLTKIKNDTSFRVSFLEEVTVNTTEMFRDPMFWLELKKQIAYYFHDHSEIKIWIAGCSSGEEVFTLGIVLKQLGLINKSQIVASDISALILSKAEEAFFDVKKIESYSNNFGQFSSESSLMDFFDSEQEGYQVNQEILSRIKFEKRNLVNDYPYDNEFDIILCRNVMIYFNQELQELTFKKFHKSLKKGGLLAIGSKESFVWSTTYAKFDELSKREKIFKKEK